MSKTRTPLDKRIAKRIPDGPVTRPELYAAHVAVWGKRPAGPSAECTTWMKRYEADGVKLTRARRLLTQAGILAVRGDTRGPDGEFPPPRPHGPARGRSRGEVRVLGPEVPGRDDVELWGRPFPREAAAAVVAALGGVWGPDRSAPKTSAIVRALLEHGYKLGRISDDGSFVIRPPTAEELEYDIAVAAAGAAASCLVVDGAVASENEKKVRDALVARIPRPRGSE